MGALEHRVFLVGIASLCVLPLCFMSQRLLEKTSAIAIFVNIYLFVLIGVMYGQAAEHDDLPHNCCLIGNTVRGNFAMASVMFQAVIIQMCVLPMYEELEDRSPEKFDKIVAVGFGCLFLIFCGFSIVGYLLIGPQVQSNILEDLPKGPWTSIAQAGVMLVVACVYPIMVYPMIAPICSGDVRMFGMNRGMVVIFAKVAIVACAFFAATFVHSLGIINVINGAMSAGIFVALIPSIFGFVMLEPGPYKKVAFLLLLVCGLVLAALGLVFSDNYVSDLTCYVSVDAPSDHGQHRHHYGGHHGNSYEW